MERIVTEYVDFLRSIHNIWKKEKTGFCRKLLDLQKSQAEVYILLRKEGYGTNYKEFIDLLIKSEDFIANNPDACRRLVMMAPLDEIFCNRDVSFEKEEIVSLEPGIKLFLAMLMYDEEGSSKL